MTREMAGTAQEHVLRWLEEGPAVFEGVRRMQRECAQFKEAAGAAQTECERLQQQCEALRAEVRRLTAETERLRTARAETAQWFTAMIKEAAARLRIEPPVRVSGGGSSARVGCVQAPPRAASAPYAARCRS